MPIQHDEHTWGPAAEPLLKDPVDFSLVLGGPMYQLWRRTRRSGGALQLLHRRAFAVAVLAWVPLLALSVAEGHAWAGRLLQAMVDPHRDQLDAEGASMAPIAISDASRLALASGVDAAQVRHLSGWAYSVSTAGPFSLARRKLRKTTATTQAEVGAQTVFVRKAKAVRGQDALLIVEPFVLLITAAHRHGGGDRQFPSPHSAT